MAAPRVTGIVETSVYVEDLDASLAFYQRLFEFDVEIKDEFICVLRVPSGQALILFPRKIADQPGRTSSPAGTVTGVIPAHGGNGRGHFAFAIDESDLDAWRERLRSNDVAVGGEVRWNRGGCSVYFRDLDDNLVELITPGLWSFY